MIGSGLLPARAAAVAGDGLTDDFESARARIELVDLAELALEHLVVLKEALHLAKDVGRELDRLLVVRERRIVDGDRHDLVVDALVVTHPEPAYRPGAHDGERMHRLLHQDENVERIPVARMRLRD